jgi:hypothetical protein
MAYQSAGVSKEAPPMTISLRWCPECGRTDRYSHLRSSGYPHNAPSGKRCLGEVREVLYELA